MASTRELERLKQDPFIDEYRILAANNGACSECQAMDGQVFCLTEAKIGINCPPFHEGCRCMIVAANMPDLDTVATELRDWLKNGEDSEFARPGKKIGQETKGVEAVTDQKDLGSKLEQVGNSMQAIGRLLTSLITLPIVGLIVGGFWGLVVGLVVGLMLVGRIKTKG